MGRTHSGSSQVVYFIQYLIIVTVVINTFVSVLNITKEAIENIINFMNLLIPILITLMLTTGNLVTTSILQPVLIFMINFIGNFINSFLIPILLISITISIVSNISDKIQIERLSKFLAQYSIISSPILLSFYVLYKLSFISGNKSYKL